LFVRDSFSDFDKLMKWNAAADVAKWFIRVSAIATIFALFDMHAIRLEHLVYVTIAIFWVLAA